jgi:hypothetical protein
MIISSLGDDDEQVAIRLPRYTAPVLATVAGACLLGITALAWRPAHDAHDTSTWSASPSTANLFGGWEQAGPNRFRDDAPPPAQPRWVLATEPSSQEVQALQSALQDHPRREEELDRLIDQTRFIKRLALWDALHKGPMSEERSTLGEHLLAVLPEHYRRGELPGPQALKMAQALIRDIEHNPQRQNARLTETSARLAHQGANVDPQQMAELSFQDRQRDPSPDVALAPLTPVVNLQAAQHALLERILRAEVH